MTFVATEEEKAQALREAKEQNLRLDTADTSVDPLTEERQIQSKYVGFLGEIVFCNRLHWQRNYPPQFDQCDAIGSMGRIEIKTRTKHFSPILVRECDFAVLLHYFKNEKGKECIALVKFYSRNYLEGHKWKIWITEKFWNYYLSLSLTPS